MNRIIFTIATLVILALTTLPTIGADDKVDLRPIIDHHQKLVTTYLDLQKKGVDGHVMALSHSLFVFDKVRKHRAQIEALKKSMTKEQLEQFEKIVAKFDKATR